MSPYWIRVDAHRRLRGPYTAAGTLLRTIRDDLLARCPELGVRHNVAILTAAPEFRGAVPEMGTPLELAAVPGQRTRFQARLHTLRVAHGLVDLLRDYLGGAPRTLLVANASEADQTDREFLEVLQRRLPSLTIVFDDSPSDESYIDSDGTNPRHLAAYQAKSTEERMRLHDERAALLMARGEFSLRLGAVPYHLSHGSDPAGAGAEAVRTAQLHCRDLGLYHAAAELGVRGRELVDRVSQSRMWWAFTAIMTTSLSSAGRAEEAEKVYEQERALSQDPIAHMHMAYETAMLYARHYEDERRDFRLARSWLNLAVAIASLLEDPKERVFYSVFNRNGLALVEVREGRTDEAIRLVNEGIETLERDLPSGDYAMHRIGLRYNRAQVYGMVGRLEEALADYATVLAADDGFPEHYFNRGNILRRMGRFADAIADYDTAIRLSPPFPEVYYNRGDARLELGDTAGALADFDRVIELNPSHVDARLNRAGIHCELDDYGRSWLDVVEGLALDPDNARLLCLKGQLLAERGDGEAAREALSAALRVDERLAEAWAVRASVAYQAGDLTAAIGDLDRAIELDDNPDFRFNRAVIHEAVLAR